MRKILFCFFIFLSCNIFAFDYFDIKWNLGNTGFGSNWFENDAKITEDYIEILNIAIEHETSGIGLEFIPVKYWNYTQKINNINAETGIWSFLNLGLYWNIINSSIFNDTIKFNIGLFNTINYLFYTEDKLNMNDFTYTAGARIGLSLPLYRDIDYFLLGGEIGYRNTNGKNAFYFCLKVEFLLYLISSVSISNNQ